MWTTLDEQHLRLADGRGPAVAAQLRRLGLLPPGRPASWGDLQRALRRLTRYAAESSVLQSVRSGNTYPVFRAPVPGHSFEIITRPEGESLAVLAVRDVPEYAAPPTFSGAAAIDWDEPVSLARAQQILAADPNAVYVLETRDGAPYRIGRSDDPRGRTMTHATNIRAHSRAFGLTPRRAQGQVRVRIGHIQSGASLTPSQIERALIRKGNKVQRGRLTNEQSTGPIRVPANQAITIQHTGAAPRLVLDRRTRDRSSLVIRGGRQGRQYELAGGTAP